LSSSFPLRSLVWPGAGAPGRPMPGRGSAGHASHEVLDPEVLPRIVAADLELGRAVGVEGILAARRVGHLAEQAPGRVVPLELVEQPLLQVLPREAEAKRGRHLPRDADRHDAVAEDDEDPALAARVAPRVVEGAVALQVLPEVPERVAG